MMWRQRISTGARAAAVAFLCVLPPAAGEEQDPREAAARLIADLGADSWETREDATRRLLETDYASLPALLPALTATAASEDAEVRIRAGRILSELKERFFLNDAKVSNGLRAKLSTERATFKKGETIKLTLAIKSEGDADIGLPNFETAQPHGRHYEIEIMNKESGKAINDSVLMEAMKQRQQKLQSLAPGESSDMEVWILPEPMMATKQVQDSLKKDDCECRNTLHCSEAPPVKRGEKTLPAEDDERCMCCTDEHPSCPLTSAFCRPISLPAGEYAVRFRYSYPDDIRPRDPDREIVCRIGDVMGTWNGRLLSNAVVIKIEESNPAPRFPSTPTGGSRNGR